MRLFVFSLLLLSVVRSQGATAFDIHSRVTFESGNHWDPISAASLLSTVEGGLISSWTLSATDVTNVLRYATNPIYNWPRPYTLSTYATNTVDTTGTRSLAVVIEIGTAEKRVQANLSANQDVLVGGFFYQNNYLNSDSSFFDFIKIQNGSADAVFQFVSASTLRWQAHTGSPSAVGSSFNQTTSQTNLYFAFKFDRRAGITNFTFAAWDTRTRSFLGQASIMLGGASYPAAATIRIGNDSHSQADVSRTNYLDSLWLSTNIAHYPTVPWDTNQFYVSVSDGSNSDSGRTPEQAWATLAFAENNAPAGAKITVLGGTYDESVTFDGSGTVSAPRYWVAESTNVICRNFIVTGNYNHFIGFYFTKVGNNTNVTPIVMTSTTGNSIQYCWFVATGHGTSGGEGGGIRLANNVSYILRRNTFQYCGTNGLLTSPTHAKDIADGTGTSGTNGLVEYNRHSHSSEYMNVAGWTTIYRNNVFGPTGAGDWGGVPHIDGLQANQAMRQYHFENNLHIDNTTTDAHMLLVQQGLSSQAAIIGNVSIRNGDAQSIWIGQGSQTSGHYISHNAIADSRAFEGAPNTAGPVYFEASSNNWAYNNAYSNVTTSARPYQFGTGGVLENYGNDLMFPQGSATSELTIADPQWENYAAYDLRPKSTSPLVDNGRGLTITVGTGSSETTVTVEQSWWFHDGYGLTRGSAVYVGDNNNLYVTAVNRANSTITVNIPISWSAGQAVGRAYLGSAPDKGPYEYGAAFLTNAIISTDSTPFATYTVFPDGDTRFVIFKANGIPQAPHYGPIFTYTRTGDEVVTADVFALWPQTNMVVTAVDGISPPPGPTFSTIPSSGKSNHATSTGGGL